MLLRDLDFVGFSGEVDDLKLSATEFRFGAELFFSFVEIKWQEDWYDMSAACHRTALKFPGDPGM